MRRKPLIAGVTAIVLVVAAVWLYRKTAGEDAPQFRVATIERGDLESSVSATGTLSAVTTVQVGTQVSGKIVETLADFNDRVQKGQLIARIDPTLLEQAVRDAEAGLERSQAELEQRKREYERSRQLFERKVLTEIEFNNAKYALAVAEANLKSARVTLDRARQNLAYSRIYAPIDGIVVERNVDVGQTVTASMSTPQLFLIANDLSRMQILASVDESDIGMIRPEQPVRFTVQAYPNETFTGTVKQVRLQSKTTENVVNYTVVVSVSNPDGRLLPGMTATVDFLTGTAHDVLLVPNAALRFRPTEEMRAQLRARQGQGNGAAQGRSPSADTEGRRAGRVRDMGSAGPPGSAGPGDSSARNGAAFTAGSNVVMLWYLDEKNQPAVTPVRTGITDGQRTEVEGPGIREGMRVIIGVTRQANSANTPMGPFGPAAPAGGFRRSPAGF